MNNKIAKEVKYLKIYSGLLTLALLSFIIMAFYKPGKKSFKELNVQRLNIVSPKGKLRMVISNSKLQSPGRLNGKKMKARQRWPGLIFFNKEGDEVGGLIYGVRGLALSVDRYKRDQIMQLRYIGSKSGKREYGLQFWDRNGNITLSRIIDVTDSLQALHYSRKKIDKTLRKMNGGIPTYAPRMFVGKKKNQQVGLFIQDKQGNDRIEIYVDKQNKVRMKFLNKNGKEIPLDSLK